jgi:hypothetical protein
MHDNTRNLPLVDAAVLVPLYRDDGGELRVVLVRRADYGVHGGQIAFPGGKREPGDRTLVDTALLAANKRIVNLGLELMGAGTLQRLAAENDARAHTAPAARQMFKDLGRKGVKQAVTERDAPFGDGRARVDGPEVRDAEGRLVPGAGQKAP